MSDIINEYFKRFYPKNIDKSLFRWSYVGFEYTDRTTRPVFPEIVCKDGFRISVQGHCGAYSFPRDDFADKYSMVEVMCSSTDDPIIMEMRDKREYDGGDIFGYVPVWVVENIIKNHGGIVNDGEI